MPLHGPADSAWPPGHHQRAASLSTSSYPAAQRRRGLLWELLTFERMLTGPVTHLVYWAGLALVSLIAFGSVGAAVGLWIRSGWGEGLLLAVPTIVVGLLVAGALALIWRSACEFFVAVFSIAEDLRAIRQESQAQGLAGAPPPPSSPSAFPATGRGPGPLA